MQPRIEVDLREFDRTIREYQRLSKKDFDEIVAVKAAQLAGAFGDGSAQMTEKADAEKMHRELTRSVRSELRIKKDGSFRLTRSGKISHKLVQVHLDDGKTSLAARIVNARRVAAGKHPIWGDELEAAATKLVNVRRRSVAFIRSGWIGAIQSINRFLPAGKRARFGGKREQVGTAKGRALFKPSGIAANPSATIINTALNALKWSGGQKSTASRVAEDGLARAFRHVMADMRTYIERKLADTARKL